MVFLLMMLIIFIMHLFGLPLPGTFIPDDSIQRAVSAGRSIKVTGKVTGRRLKDSGVSYILSDSYRADDPSRTGLRNIRLFSDESLKVGSIITVYGKLNTFDHAPNPGGFDAYTYYAADDIWLSLYVTRVTEVREPKYLFAEAAALFKETLKENIMKLCGETNGAVISAMILGEKSELSYELRSGYTVTGLSHLLAISGLHIGLLGMSLYRLLLLFRMKRAAASVLSSLFLFSYCVFTGSAESSVRAFVMFTVMVMGQCIYRSYDSLSALSLAGIILLVRSPYTLFRPGFQLSFLAAASLSVIYPVLKRVFSKKKGTQEASSPSAFRRLLGKAAAAAKDGALVFFSVQLFTLPVMLYSFYEICPYGVLANILFVPVTAALMIFSIFGALVSLLSLSAASFIMIIPNTIASLEAGAGEVLKALPYARITTGQCDMWYAFVYYAALLLLVWLIRNRAAVQRYALNLAVCSLVMCGLFAKRAEPWSITALDVGQGDCFVIRTSDGAYFLSDGGSSDVNDVGRYRIGPYLKSRGIRYIDGVFLSHEDEDHVNGVEELLEDMADGNIDLNIGHVFISETMSRTEAGRRIAAKAARCGTVTETLSAGDNVKAGTSEFRILYPSAGLDASGNDASMVFEYKDGWMNALFTGDIGFEGEEEILANMASYGSTDITYLKAAHHGSKNSTSDEFLEATTPEICVISAPENSFYGHPHRELLERLENAGARFFQTGKGGAVKAVISEKGVTITQYND